MLCSNKNTNVPDRHADFISKSEERRNIGVFIK